MRLAQQTLHNSAGAAGLPHIRAQGRPSTSGDEMLVGVAKEVSAGPAGHRRSSIVKAVQQP
jgi:hypothetical protein